MNQSPAHIRSAPRNVHSNKSSDNQANNCYSDTPLDRSSQQFAHKLYILDHIEYVVIGHLMPSALDSIQYDHSVSTYDWVAVWSPANDRNQKLFIFHFKQRDTVNIVVVSLRENHERTPGQASELLLQVDPMAECVTFPSEYGSSNRMHFHPSYGASIPSNVSGVAILSAVAMPTQTGNKSAGDYHT